MIKSLVYRDKCQGKTLIQETPICINIYIITPRAIHKKVEHNSLFNLKAFIVKIHKITEFTLTPSPNTNGPKFLYNNSLIPISINVEIIVYIKTSVFRNCEFNTLIK